MPTLTLTTPIAANPGATVTPLGIAVDLVGGGVTLTVAVRDASGNQIGELRTHTFDAGSASAFVTNANAAVGAFLKAHYGAGTFA